MTGYWPEDGKDQLTNHFERIARSTISVRVVLVGPDGKAVGEIRSPPTGSPVENSGGGTCHRQARRSTNKRPRRTAGKAAVSSPHRQKEH
jgi:hypothetical protein